MRYVNVNVSSSTSTFIASSSELALNFTYYDTVWTGDDSNEQSNNDDVTNSGYDVMVQAIKACVLLVIVCTAVFGNTLVIVSVLRTPKLRSVANAFVVSLAFADLLVALLVMTFSASQEILGEL